MSVRAVAWVLHESPATGNDRLVLIAIADEADDAGRNAFPGIDLIAHKARVDKRTTMRALGRLEATGELLIRRPDHPGRGRFNRYVVVMGRDPDALAGELGWPPPPLDPATVAALAKRRECQNDTLGIRPISPPPQPGENHGDDDPGKARIGDTGDGFGNQTTPGAALDPDPDRHTGAPAPNVNTRRRRGLDPSPPSPLELSGLAARALADAGNRQVAESRLVEPAGQAQVDAALAEARAALSAMHTAQRTVFGDGSSLRTPNEDDLPPAAAQ